MNMENEIENNNEFAKMLEEQEKSNSVSGGIINAIIVKITNEIVFLDTNSKQEKTMPLSEILDESGNPQFKVNDSIDIVLKNGVPSYKKVLEQKKIKEFIKKLNNDELDKTISAKVVSKNKGGYVVEYDGMNFFMPRSLSMLKSADDQIGRTIDVSIIKHSESEGILVSRKHFLDNSSKEFEQKAQALLDKNEIVKCKVKKLINFGIFVDIDGITGVVRYSELSHKGNIDPRDSFQVDQEIEAKILGIDEKRKVVELSIKALLDDPWSDIENQIKVGDKVQGTVANIQSYGAFVNIESKDLDGLLHISEISWDRSLKTPADKLSIGEKLELLVIDINKDKKQLKCSLKQLSESPFCKFAEQYNQKDIVTGKIVHITDFGAFVNIGSIDCLLLNVNCSWKKGDTCKSLFKVGEEIEVCIDSIDKENEKVYLNRKSLLESPIDEFNKQYGIGDKITGKIANIKDFGVFVKVELLDIFIPIKDIAPLKPNELSVGQEIESIIADIDIENSRVRATIKEKSTEDGYSRGSNSGELKNFGDDSRTTLGDIMRMKK